MVTAKSIDLLTIGAGGGGYPAAFRLARAGTALLIRTRWWWKPIKVKTAMWHVISSWRPLKYIAISMRTTLKMITNSVAYPWRINGHYGNLQACRHTADNYRIMAFNRLFTALTSNASGSKSLSIHSAISSYSGWFLSARIPSFS